MKQAAKRARAVRIRKYNQTMRNRGIVNIDGAPAEIAAKVRAHILSKHGSSSVMGVARAAAVSTDPQQNIPHANLSGQVFGVQPDPSGQVFGVQPSKRSKYHAVTGAGTIALCGKDVGEWSPEPGAQSSATLWEVVDPAEYCSHCFKMVSTNGNGPDGDR